MRIVSQDKESDVAYEMVMLRILRTNKEYCVHACTENIDYEMAFYSTEEKAKKAMDMCREKYLARIELDGGYDIVNKCYVQPNYWILPKVFQFPKDEEIEI